MRVSAVFVLATAAFLFPALGTADPAQPEPMTAPAPATPAQPQNVAPGAAAPVSAAAPGRPAAGETVLVNGRAQNDNSGSLDRVVCRVEPAPVGSRLGGSRACYTVRQWNARQKQSHKILDNIQIRGLSEGTR